MFLLNAAYDAWQVNSYLICLTLLWQFLFYSFENLVAIHISCTKLGQGVSDIIYIILGKYSWCYLCFFRYLPKWKNPSLSRKEALFSYWDTINGISSLHFNMRRSYPSPISTLSRTSLCAEHKAYIWYVDWLDYQVQASLAPPTADPHGYWSDCKSDHAHCNSSQIQFFQGNSSVAFWFALGSDLWSS